MKREDSSIKKRIKRRIGIQSETKMSARDKLRRGGTLPKAVPVGLRSRGEIRRGRRPDVFPERIVEVPEILENITKKTCVINQFGGIGDILFIEPIMRHYFQNGYEVILPVMKRYRDIQPNFPYVKIVDMTKYDIDYDERKLIETEDLLVLPLRFSVPSMRQKYGMLDMDWQKWRELTWLRHRYKEDALKKRLGIKEGEEFNLINRYFSSNDAGYREIDVKNGLRNIEMKSVRGYNLLDWTGVIESATNIFTVNTSIIYMLEVLDLNAKEIHVYARRDTPDEISKTDYLFNKKFIRHK